MGIEQVDHRYRELTEANGYGAEHWDIGMMRIHHTYAPKTNYCDCELKMPAVRYQMYSDDYENILESLRLPSLHGIRFLSVDNDSFYNMIKDVEGADNIDKVRRYAGDIVYTYYFSNTRRLKLFPHDYYMPAFIYMSYPARNYYRRTPCKKIHPECYKCWEWLRDPARSYLYEGAEEFEAHIYKYFFEQIGQVHRLLMGYTVEKVKKPGECFTSEEPEYFITDYDVKYFKGGIKTRLAFENEIMRRKRTINEDIYHLIYGGGGGVNWGTDRSGYQYVTYLGGGGKTGHASINIANREAPDDILDALDNNDFENVWKFDFMNFNTRNTIHKFQYNHWAYLCTRAEDGLWCAWDATETINESIANAPGDAASKNAVRSQLLQASSMAGWGPTSDMSSSDTVFTYLAIKEEGINYEEVIEPLPQRDSSLF